VVPLAWGMPNRSSKRPWREDDDVNQLAARVVAQATGQEPPKNPAAVALGRLGGKKGGPARAAKLSPAKRREIAQRAAKARWDRRARGA
jgi:hypothetical protein